MHASLIQIIFYIFAAMTIGCALMVITQNNPVRCVLFLVLTFFSSSVLWILAEAEFLALILILVYVGAVMTLFLFVVMMLNIDVETMQKHYVRYLPFGLIIVGLFVGLLLVSIPKDVLRTNTGVESLSVNSQIIDNLSADEKSLSNSEALGLVLYTDYFLVFELAAAILLVAIIAAITLVNRGARHSKKQNIIKQIMTRPEDRVKLIKMKSED